MIGVSPAHIPAPQCYLPAVIKNGGNNRARTYDPLLVRQMLSQLSYASIRRQYFNDLVIIAQRKIIVKHFFHIFSIFSIKTEAPPLLRWSFTVNTDIFPRFFPLHKASEPRWMTHSSYIFQKARHFFSHPRQ